MFRTSGAISRDDFFDKLSESFEGVYKTNKAFSLVVLEVVPSYRNKVSQDAYSFVMQDIAKEIWNYLSKDTDYYSFMDNSFFIYSTVDSSNKIQEFIDFIASVLKRDFQGDFLLQAGYGIYPYDALDLPELLTYVREHKKLKNHIGNVKKSKDDASQLRRIKASNMEIMNEVHTLMSQLNIHDKYLFNHSMLVAQSSIYFAKELSFDNKMIKNIAVAALLHDIGYLKIPVSIINKKGKLSAKEWGLIKLHPVLATRNILNNQPIFKDVLDIIERHHEFIDGSGYPFGIKGSDISIESQVLSMMDTYQAIITSRHYRRALSLDEVIDIFVKNAGIKWEEDFVTMFCAIIGDPSQRKFLTDRTFSSVSEIFEII